MTGGPIVDEWELLGARNPLIQRYFLGYFVFPKSRPDNVGAPT
jgi:hypothetical protein